MFNSILGEGYYIYILECEQTYQEFHRRLCSFKQTSAKSCWILGFLAVGLQRARGVRPHCCNVCLFLFSSCMTITITLPADTLATRQKRQRGNVYDANNLSAFTNGRIIKFRSDTEPGLRSSNMGAPGRCASSIKSWNFEL